ncbi:MAG: hypothetical protein JO125_08800, partial [Chloroflexi bacterium]|nr:hypothetical protein [Chloroflexota bacterium]
MAIQLEYGLTMQQTALHAVESVTFDSLPLQFGGNLGPITLAYETWGTLNAEA